MKINNNELAMPKNYAVVNEEEMTYVDGGVSVDKTWWGYYIYLNHEETQNFFIGSMMLTSPYSGIPFVIKAIMTAERVLIKSYDKGNGVCIRITTLGTAGVITGISSITNSAGGRGSGSHR